MNTYVYTHASLLYIYIKIIINSSESTHLLHFFPIIRLHHSLHLAGTSTSSYHTDLIVYSCLKNA